MNNKVKKVLKIIIVLLIIYLIISSLYIFLHIDFEYGKDQQMVVGMGFSETNNIVRQFMGLPKTYTTYDGVSPIYLISVVVRVILAIALIIVKKRIKY